MAPDRADEHYVVAGRFPWNRRAFDRRVGGDPRWRYVDTVAEVEKLAEAGVRYAFFLHWSHLVPKSVVEACECVCFHMTDVPYGRGGSPLQNLVLRGHDTTVLTALRMVEELDAGPVYAKRPLSLEGTAEAILVRASEMAMDMAVELAAAQPTPVPQEGEVTAFRRRRPAESRLPAGLSLDALHDFIRMLDAEGYPHAYVEVDGYRLELTRSNRYDDRVEAVVTITDGRG